MQDERFDRAGTLRRSPNTYSPAIEKRSMRSRVTEGRQSIDSLHLGSSMGSSQHGGTHSGDLGIHERSTMHFQNDNMRANGVDWSRLQCGDEALLMKPQYASFAGAARKGFSL